MYINAKIKFENFSAIGSENTRATDFGIISPKIKTAMVAAVTAIPKPLLPAIFIIIAVKRTEIKMFTRLLPIKDVVKNCCLLFRIFSTRAAFLLFFSFKYFILSLFTERNAVSPDEKIIDKKSRKDKKKIYIHCGGSFIPQ